MDVAVIDWKSIDSRVVVDDLYEHINAPKWVDLTASNDNVDDEVWFCRPGCDHPKTVDDFFNEKEKTPISNSKIRRSASVSDFPPYNRSNRDGTLKNRGINHKNTSYYDVALDENQDPNFSTPLAKGGINSSPKLKKTLSARNLFTGVDLLSKVSDFCNELKKLATRAHENDRVHENVGVLNGREKEKKPLLEQSKEKREVMSSSKGKLRRKKRIDDSENTPISVDVKSIKYAEGKQPIQISPPTPQCFSAGYGNSKSSTPKPFRVHPTNQERGILQEVKQIERERKSNHGGRERAEREPKSLDVFWFLKPCTLSS